MAFLPAKIGRWRATAAAGRSGQRRAEIALVEGDQRIRAGVQCGFQNHFILGVAQLRPPAVVQAHGLDQDGECIEKHIHLAAAQAVHALDFRALEHAFVLQPQRGCRQQVQASSQGMTKQPVRCATLAAKPRDQDVGVKDDSHDIE